jgi:hypothetical protein
MNYSEHLHDFLDGSLDGAQEQSLFSELASNSVLRTEMKDWLAMKSAVWSDVRSFAPPVDAGESLFSALNFSSSLSAGSGSMAGAGVASAGIWYALKGSMVGKMFLGGSLSQSVVPFLMGWLLSLALSSAVFAVWGNDINALIHGASSSQNEVFLNTPSKSPALPAQQNIRQSNTEQHNNGGLLHDTLHIAPESGGEYHNIPISTYTNTSANGRESVHRRYLSTPYASAIRSYQTFSDDYHRTAPKYDALSQRIASALQSGMQAMQSLTEIPDAEYSTVQDIEFSPMDPTRSSLVLNDQPDIPITPAPLSSTLPSGEASSIIAGLPFVAELRGISAQSLSTPTIGSGVQPFLTNGAVGLRAKLSSSDEVGIEAGREAYFQSFTMRNAENDLFRVEQQPVLSWAGISYRHTFMPESVVAPFVHSVLGITEVGPLARMMAGIVVRPDKRVSFILGAESSVSAFRYHGTWFASPKIGLSYGVSISF